MATIVLSAAGMALGGSIGGSVLGLSVAAIGRLAGASLGRVVDQRLLGSGSEPVETGRVDRFRLTGASEGANLPQVFGRMRVAGQVIWATQFQESASRSGGGKGAAPRPQTTSYSYSVSLAIALCEGEIARVGRVWADGIEVARDDLNMRVYSGAADQLPDPKIEAVEGAGQTPAYRGVAYVVFEDLGLSQFGNRVPQFTFEVVRAGAKMAPDGAADLAQVVQGVALVPGTGEYGLATTPVYRNDGFGARTALNINSPSGKTDFVTSVSAMEEELPNCGSVSLVVSWFGNDLRCGACTLQPMVETTTGDPSAMPWMVSGQTRATAAQTPQISERPVYGGTPTDASIIEAIGDLNTRSKSVVFYPFILMDQIADNGLADPWTGVPDQPTFPWRGRITLSVAPGQAGTPDQTALADTQVAAFFGQAQPSDFTAAGTSVSYSGPAEWSYRRFILHYAHLCAMAGGVDGFCIGSEMRALTQIRGAAGFPAVDAMRTLAGDVRAILGPNCKIGYAADWSEYHGYQPVGTGDKLFHLDPLWADPNIDFIGIDNYMPLADWRDGEDHADADVGSIYNLDYLRSNVAGGEGYDWYYHSPEARDAQIRTPISDFWGEDWVWHCKDLRGWWANSHHDRLDGQRSEITSPWVPQSKPIWFTELGCGAINKGANEPNRFYDPKSSESGYPHYSNGLRDDLMQMQYLRAVHSFYDDAVNNPLSAVDGQRMVDLGRTHVWAWDARPYPFFPANQALWSDGANYPRGHWINGRATAQALSSVVAQICTASGVEAFDVSRLYGHVRGYVLRDVQAGRAALQPLMLAYGFDAVERDGVLHFITRLASSGTKIDGSRLAITAGTDSALELQRAPLAELAGRVRLGYIEADGDYEIRASEAVSPYDDTMSVSQSELPLVLTTGEGQRIAERWLSEARVARDTARFALPPSQIGIGAGDIVQLDGAGGAALYRVDRVEQTETQMIEAVRIEPESYRPHDGGETAPALRPFTAPVPVEAMFLDLPLLSGDEVPHAPHIAMTGVPWPGSVALYSAAQDSDYALNALVAQRSVVGITQSELFAAPSGVWDRGAALRVKLVSGQLASRDMAEVLTGANLAAIGDGSSDSWEVFQFASAELVAPDTYDLRMRLRGQAGSDGMMPADWPVGSRFVLLNGQPEQIDLAAASRGVARHFRFGPAQKALDDPSYRYRVDRFLGNGLRPYSVAHLRSDGGMNTTFSWVRRTRIDGDPWEGLDVPLGEARETYVVRVIVNGNVVRETQVISPSWTYNAPLALIDGATGHYSVEIAQVSERYGAGPTRTLVVAA